jgi:metallo-beta-lactamase family protein
MPTARAISRHAPALPLYGEADAFRAVSLLQPVGYERPMPVAEGIEVDFPGGGSPARLGYARVRTDGMTILFGGDLGRYNGLYFPIPSLSPTPTTCSWSRPYGNRLHEKDDDGERSRKWSGRPPSVAASS